MSLGSEAKSVVQKEVRDRGGGAIASPARGALSPITRAAGTDSPGSLDQLASRSCGAATWLLITSD
jgi:hypothetical protein